LIVSVLMMTVVDGAAEVEVTIGKAFISEVGPGGGRTDELVTTTVD
jgi:hypothetical protein